MPKTEIRRIVTKHDANGKATVWFDGLAQNQRSSDGHATSTLMWATEETPAPFLVAEDAGDLMLGTPPPAGGTRFGVIELPSGRPAHSQHRTDSVDYVICISGSVDMDLDDETVHMEAGDVMVQLGTNHAWVNRGEEPCRLAFVLVDGHPKREDSVAAGKTQTFAQTEES